MKSWNSYPKIHNFGSGAVVGFKVTDECWIEEKVDGSQFSFGVTPDGEVWCKSRNKNLHEEPNKMFGLGVATVEALAAEGKLMPGWTDRGEYLAKPKHNSLTYDRVPVGHIILFDVARGENVYMDRFELEDEADNLGLEVVPVLHKGALDSVEEMEALLETPSVLGGMIEGFVIKRRDAFGKDGKPIYQKYVSDKFRELHSKNPDFKKTPKVDIITQIAASVCPEARWDKAVQRLRDAGELTNEPRDIGNLIKSVRQDIQDEGKEFIKEALYQEFGESIQKVAVRGLAEWYKKRLATAAMEGE